MTSGVGAVMCSGITISRGMLAVGLIASVSMSSFAADYAPLLDDDGRRLVERIDQRLAERWQEAGLAPNAAVGEGEFLRRASLDLTGVIPSVGEVRAFLADESADKRGELIERLLKRPNHATRMAYHWRDALLPRNNQAIFGQAPFEQWLRVKFADNMPYDQLVRELLTVRGNLGESGPVVYYAALESKPEELAASTSRIFLGVQIACAQCHKHPFDHWTQHDFWGYAAFFAQLASPPSRQQSVSFVADAREGEVFLPSTTTVVKPRFLGSPDPAPQSDQTRRQQLATWLASRDNPYFVKAAVSRVWALLFGYGLVNPIDDLGPHNPPVDDILLQEIADDFAGHGFNLRRLIRIIAATRAYGLSSETLTETPDEPALFHRMPVKALSAEQLWDCIAEATCRREPAIDTTLPQRGIQGNPTKQAFLAKFEASTQAATEFQSGIPQALSMMNGEVINDATDLAKSSLLLALADGSFFTADDRLEILFLATLTRLPTDAEREKFLAYVDAGGASRDPNRALADVLWALLNSSEFFLNH